MSYDQRITAVTQHLMFYFLTVDANHWSLRNEASCRAKWVQVHGQADFKN